VAVISVVNQLQDDINYVDHSKRFSIKPNLETEGSSSHGVSTGLRKHTNREINSVSKCSFMD
jgi:hypothetical protein